MPLKTDAQLRTEIDKGHRLYWSQRAMRFGPPPKSSIDLGLAVNSVLMRPGDRITQEDLADICECSQAAIYLIEKRALRKLRLRLKREDF